RTYKRKEKKNIRNVYNKRKLKKNTVSFSKKLEKFTISDFSIKLKTQRIYKKKKKC
ncbi:hypothetical protein C1645_783133, partial [Glomus cerebriforme]